MIEQILYAFIYRVVVPVIMISEEDLVPHAVATPVAGPYF